jgi:hypothetical protein
MNSLSPDFTTRCDARLDEVTKADKDALVAFAKHRLVALGAPSSCAEDIVQKAFEAVLRGLEGTGKGSRNPRSSDIVDKPAFLNYLRGIISSLVWAMTCKREFRIGHRPWDEIYPPPQAGGQSPAEEAEWRDLQEQLFPRLRARAPRRLWPTIDAWEEVFLHSDRIPAPGSRKYVREVRNLAQEILWELGYSWKLAAGVTLQRERAYSMTALGPA